MIPIYTNLFSISIDPQMTQVVFKNQASTEESVEPVAHMVMTTSNAVELARLILKLTGQDGPAPQ